MRIEPQIPTVQDAVRHFQDMARGRVPNKDTRPRRRLFGGWGGNGPTVMTTTLVTPAAMALEQAKADLIQKGERLPRAKRAATKRTTKKPKSGDRPKAKGKSAIKGSMQKKRLQSAIGPRRVKTK